MSFTFTVTRDNTAQITNPLTVNLTVGGTATFGTDYTVSGAASFTTTAASVIIPGGATSATIIATQIPDAVVEPDETIILTIVPTSGVSILGVNPAATATILDDDAPSSAASTILLHFDATPIVDSSISPKTVSLQGSASISTGQFKFGASSLSVPENSSSSVDVSDSAAISLGSANFTIDFWIRPTATGYVLGKGDAATVVGSSISWLLGSACSFYVGGSRYSLPTAAPPLNEWSHLAITRNGDTLRYFVNGVEQSTLAISGAINTTTNPLRIGVYRSGAAAGFIDEFRLIVGSAEYTTNFTPPITPYKN